jgi:hypothetical protein
LDRDGRAADAFSACQRARKELAEVLGIEPDPLALEEDIISADVTSKTSDDDLVHADWLPRSGSGLLKTAQRVTCSCMNP